MILNKQIAAEVASRLLQIKAIQLNPQNPFTWASGWQSPIYCDNRKTLSYPAIRTFIKKNFIQVIRENFPQAQLIGGVATAGIPHGALIADGMDLPFAYARSQAKGHGLQNKIEGIVQPGQKVVVVEDLISTGKSSLQAVEAFRGAGAEVLGLVAIFTYQFDVAQQQFAQAGCPYFTLSDYTSLIAAAEEDQFIEPSMIQSLSEWRQDPGNWGN